MNFDRRYARATAKMAARANADRWYLYQLEEEIAAFEALINMDPSCS